MSTLRSLHFPIKVRCTGHADLARVPEPTALDSVGAVVTSEAAFGAGVSLEFTLAGEVGSMTRAAIGAPLRTHVITKGVLRSRSRSSGRPELSAHRQALKDLSALVNYL